MKIDILTLMMALALVHGANLIFSILMIASRQVFPGAFSWLAGQSSVVLAAILSLSLSAATNPFWSLALPNTMYFLSSIFLLNALWHFRYGKSLPRPVWGSVLVFMLGFCLLLGSTINARIVLFSVFMGAAEFAGAFLLFVGVRRELRLPCAVAGLAFGFAVLVHGLRLWDALNSPVIVDFYRQDAIQTLIYLVSILSAYMMLFGYFMMTGMRYAIELREKDELIKGRNEELGKLNDTNIMMMSVIAHDLRNPVSSAARYVRKHLLPAEIDIEKKRDAIRVLAKTLADTDNLLENLLMWAKDRTALEDKPDPIRLDLASVIRPTLDAVAQSAAEKSISISYGGGSHFVLAERNGTDVVFRNLLSNAVKFTPLGGSVKIDSRSVDGMVEVSVSDSGRGMDEESVARLNGGGELRSSAGTAGEKGSGMGLSLCRRFMLRQGGSFSVESEPGKGSRFILRFPAYR